MLFNHSMYLCRISLCLQTLTCQEQVSLASLVLNRHKAQWERGEPVHPCIAMYITFKWENTLPESCFTCFSQSQSTKTDSSASSDGVVMVVPGSCSPEIFPGGCGSAYTGKLEHREGCCSSFPRACAEIPNMVIPKLVKERVLCTPYFQAISEQSLGQLVLTNPPGSSLQAPSHLRVSSNSSMKGQCFTDRLHGVGLSGKIWAEPVFHPCSRRRGGRMEWDAGQISSYQQLLSGLPRGKTAKLLQGESICSW